MASNDANNANNVQLRLFGNGSSTTSTAEWLQIGFESSSVLYAIRTAQGGASSARPLVLSATAGSNQIILNTNGSIAFSSTATFSGAVSVTSTQDATSASSYGSAALGVAGGLAVAKTLVVGTAVQSPLAQISETLELNASGSLDKVSMSYTSAGQLNVFNNSTSTVNIHTGNSVGPTSPNQEKLVLGYMDTTAHTLHSFASGTGVVKDLVMKTGTNANQMRLYASDGSVRFAGDVHVTSTTAGALRVSGGISASGSSNFALGASFGTAGQTGPLLTLNGATSWRLSSIDTTYTYLQPVGTNGAFCIANSASAPMLTINTRDSYGYLICTFLFFVTKQSGFNRPKWFRS